MKFITELGNSSKSFPKEEYVLSHFMWEDYIIQFRTHIYQISKFMSDEDKQQLAEELMLLSHFQIRRGSDLGLNQYVYNQMLQGAKNVEYKKLILTLLGKYMEDSDVIQNKIDQGKLHQKVQLTGILGKLLNVNRYDLEDVRSHNRDQILKFYQRKLKEFENDNDQDSEYITQIILSEYTTGVHRAFETLLPHDQFEDSLYHEHYNFKIKRFLFSNLKFPQVYEENINDLSIKQLIDLTSENLSEFIINEINTILNFNENNTSKSANKEDPEPKVQYYNMLLNYTLSILSVQWFWNLTYKEKIKVMATEYRIKSFQSKILEMGYQNTDIDKEVKNIIFINTQLCNQGLENGGVGLIFRYLKGKKRLNKKHKIDLLREVAMSFRGRSDFTRAVKYLEKAAKLFTKSEYNSYEYNLIKIRIGEQYLLLKRNDPAFKIINSVKKRIKKLDKKLYLPLLMNLARTYKRARLYNNELEILEEIFQEDDIGYIENQRDNPLIRLRQGTSEYLGTIDQRFLLLKEIRRGTLPKMELDQYELINQAEVAFRKGKNRFNSYDFENSIFHLTQSIELLKIIGDPTIKFYHVAYYYLGMTQSYREKYIEAYLTFIESHEIYNQHVGIIGNILVLCFLEFGELTSKVEDTIKSYDPLQLKQLVEFSIEYLLTISDISYFDGHLNYLNSTLNNIVNNYSLNFDLYTDAGSSLADLGFQSEAIKIYNMIQFEKLSDSQKSQVETNIGSVYANKNDHREAINHYMNALKFDKTNAVLMSNIAASYGYLMDFDQAIQYSNDAINATKNNTTYSSYLPYFMIDNSYYKNMKGEKTKLNNIPDKYVEVKRLLRTAERTFLEFKRNYNLVDLDAFSIVSSYAKAIERLLHILITKPFFDDLLQLHHGNVPSTLLRNTERSVRDSFKAHRNGNIRSISLGSWPYVFNGTDTLISDLLLYIDNTFGSKCSNEINAALGEIVDPINSLTIHQLRNDVSHVNTIDFNRVMRIRKNIIIVINKIIDALFTI